MTYKDARHYSNEVVIIRPNKRHAEMWCEHEDICFYCEQYIQLRSIIVVGDLHSKIRRHARISSKTFGRTTIVRELYKQTLFLQNTTAQPKNNIIYYSRENRFSKTDYLISVRFIRIFFFFLERCSTVHPVQNGVTRDARSEENRVFHVRSARASLAGDIIFYYFYYYYFFIIVFFPRFRRGLRGPWQNHTERINDSVIINV